MKDFLHDQDSAPQGYSKQGPYMKSYHIDTYLSSTSVREPISIQTEVEGPKEGFRGGDCEMKKRWFAGGEIPVDTVHLFTNDFRWNGQVSNWAKSIVVENRSPSSHDIKLLFTCSKTRWRVEMIERSLRLAGSLPRLFSATNLEAISVGDWPKAIAHLQGMLESLGVTTSIESMRVSRIDVFQNRVLSCPVATITEALNRLDFVGRMKNKGSKQYRSYYVRFENSKRAIVVYDKGQEIRRTRTSSRLCRIEVRIMSSSGCAGKGIICFKDILNSETLKSIWMSAVKQLENAAIHNGLAARGMRVDGIEDRFKKLLSSECVSQHDLNQFVAISGGVQAFILTLGGMDHVSELIRSLVGNKKALRWIRHLQELHGAAENVTTVNAPVVPLEELFGEDPLETDDTTDLCADERVVAGVLPGDVSVDFDPSAVNGGSLLGSTALIKG